MPLCRFSIDGKFNRLIATWLKSICVHSKKKTLVRVVCVNGEMCETEIDLIWVANSGVVFIQIGQY